MTRDDLPLVAALAVAYAVCMAINWRVMLAATGALTLVVGLLGLAASLRREKARLGRDPRRHD